MEPSRLVVLSGTGYPELATAIAEDLGCENIPVEIRKFSNGETYVRVTGSVRGADVYIVQSFSGAINDLLVETLLMIDALKRGSAQSITVVAPYLPYSRQDKKHLGREPISARVIPHLLNVAGAGRIVTVDLHSDQIQGFFDGPVDHLSASGLLAKHLRDHPVGEKTTVVAPDAGRVKAVERMARALPNSNMAFVHKQRRIDQPNVVTALSVVGDVRGRDCVLLDDMVDTAGTLVAAVEQLQWAGAASVRVAATHAILSGPAAERLKAAKIDSLVVTDTLPCNRPEIQNLEVLPISPLLAGAIRHIHGGASTSELVNSTWTGNT